MTFAPSAAIGAARQDLGFSSGHGRCNPFTEWQTRGQVRCAPFCASALSMWLSEGGYRFDPSEHVWGDRGDWNVTTFRQWAQRRGLWRDRHSHARASWGVVLNFGMVDQHIGMVAAQAAAGQPVATIEGNTNGGRVMARVRSFRNVQGFIAFDEAGQNAGAPVAKPPQKKEMREMSMVILPPGPNTTKGRDATAIADFDRNCVRVDNGGRLKGQTGISPAGSAEWLPDELVAGSKILSVAKNGNVVVSLWHYPPTGERLTYRAEILD